MYLSGNTVHLLEMALINRKYRLGIYIIIRKYLINPLRAELLVGLIRHVLHQIPHLFPHLHRKIDAKALL